MLGLYVHIPFCEHKCFYCSFVVAVGKHNYVNNYLDILSAEAKQYAGCKISTIYIGGGTPTVLDSSQLENLFLMIQDTFDCSSVLEWTVEANPEGISADQLNVLKNSGVTRVSLGVQSLNNTFLSYLGRNHNRQKAIQTYHMMREHGFDNINLDLMYGFPGQSIDDLKEDLEAITALKSEHLSLYSLMIEENSRFYTKGVKLPDTALQAEFYQIVLDALEVRGFNQYEVSNFSKEGYESKHNFNYWRCKEYIGLGVGAHSFFQNKRYKNTSKFSEYIDSKQNHGYSANSHIKKLPTQELFKDALLFGLRMNKGIDVSALEKRFAVKLGEQEKKWIDIFVMENLLNNHDGALKVTDQGRLVLDEICARLL